MRRKKWLRRGVYFLVFLVALYLLFWWALFNPLEGSVKSLVVLVPEDVNYVIHCPWGSLRETPFFTDGLMKGDLKRNFDEKLDFESRLYAPMREVEQQLNDSVPDLLGLFADFTVLGDFAGKELLVAGMLTGAGDELGQKIGNSPFVALTRISFRAKFIEILQYDIVRERIPGLEIYPGYYQFDLGEEFVQEGAPDEARYIYFSRIRDVLAVSNNQDLIQKVVRLGEAAGNSDVSNECLPGGDRDFFFDVMEPTKDPGVTFWFKVRKSDYELGYELSGFRRPEGEAKLPRLVSSFFPVGLTKTFTLELGVEGVETIPLRGKIRMDLHRKLPQRISRFHREVGRDLKRPVEKWAELASGDRTFAFAWWGMDPENTMLSLFKSLDASSRKAYFPDSGRGSGRPGGGSGERAWTEEDIARRLGEWFEDGVGLSFARLPEVEEFDFGEFDSGDPDPIPGLTFYLEVRPRLDPDDLVEFFRRNHTKLAFTKMTEIPAPVGRLFELDRVATAGDKLYQPGFALIGRDFLFASNIGELRRMLEARNSGHVSLLSRETFREALDRCHTSGKLFLFVDVSLLHRHLLDHRCVEGRNTVMWVPKKVRGKIRIELERRHPDWDRERLMKETDDLFDLEEQKMMAEDFPLAVEEYVKGLDWLESVEWIGLSGDVTGDQSYKPYFGLKGAIRLADPEVR